MRKVLQDARKSVLHFLLRFETVVEYNNRPGPDVLNDILIALFVADRLVEIPTQHIPHHDLIVPQKELSLLGSHPSVRWPEEIAIDELSTVAHIVEVRNIVLCPARDMIVRMVADRVSFSHDALENGRMALHIFPDTKERGLGIKSGQLVEDPRGYFRDRSVIEREIKNLVSCIDPPGEARKETLNKVRCVNQVHSARLICS